MTIPSKTNNAKQQLYKTNDNNLHLHYNNYVKTTKNDKKTTFRIYVFGY